MRAVYLRRSAVAVVSLTLFATACGGAERESREQGDDAPRARPAAAPTPESPAVAELEGRIVEQADLKAYEVEDAGPADFASARLFSTAPDICKPIADTISFVPPGNPTASARRRAVALPKDNPTATPEEAVLELGAPMTAVMLGSYEGNRARDLFASLKKAGAECAGGFTMSGGGVTTKTYRVAVEPMTAGEEALALTVSYDGESEKTRLAFFRKGNVLAAFCTFGASGEAIGLSKAAIDAQATKLG